LAQLIGGTKPTPVLSNDAPESTEKNRVIIIICAILLALTVVGTLMLWIVCWRFHKDRLARKIANELICQQQVSD
jgi:heme/copper-type cytochrome/quinol oxidase subunit 2